MRAIILAAGRGSRMGDLTDHGPKAMLPLHGKPFIEWQMQAISDAGIKEIAIVNGYKSEVFTYHVTYFNNPQWAQTNMLSTLLCADKWLTEGDCLVSYSDIIYQVEAVQALLNVPGDVVIAFDQDWLRLWMRRFADPLSDAETFQYAGNRLINVGGRAHNLNMIQGQYMGLLKFTVDGWKKAKAVISTLPKDLMRKLDMTGLLNLMLEENYIINVAKINSQWCEVDSQKDYMLCKEIISPRSYVY